MFSCVPFLLLLLFYLRDPNGEEDVLEVEKGQGVEKRLGGSQRKERPESKPSESDQVSSSIRSSSAPKYERELSVSPATTPLPERLHSQSVVFPVRGSKRTSFHSEGGNHLSQSFVLLSADRLSKTQYQCPLSSSSASSIPKSLSTGNLRLEELVSTTPQTDFLKNVKFKDIHDLIDPSKLLPSLPSLPSIEFGDDGST